MIGRLRSGRAAALLVTCFVSAHALGAAFQLAENSVKGLGTSFAGGGAAGEDASVIFFNPAAMSLLSSREVALAAHGIIPFGEFENANSRRSNGTALNGVDGGDAGQFAAVANAYYAQDLWRNIKFGVGINTPFGLTTTYDRGWNGRYHALHSKLLTLNVNPALSAKFGWLSIGVGASAQYAKTRLTNAVDFSSLLTNGATQGTQDGETQLIADDWSLGLNGGILADFGGTRFSAAYRSQVTHTLSGSAAFSFHPSTSAANIGILDAAGFRATTAEAQLTFPATASASIYHAINDRWAVMGDFTFTNWDSLGDPIAVRYGSGVSTTLDVDFEDAVRISLGVSHRYSNRLTLRAGTAFDETPVPRASSRTARLPDSDRYWLSFGASYDLVPKELSIDVGLAYLYLPDVKIRQREPLTNHVLDGNYELSIGVASAQVNWRF